MKNYLYLMFLFCVCCNTPAQKKIQPSSVAGKHLQANEAASDSALLDVVERQTFKYFRDGAEPMSGMARERFNEDNIYPENDKMVVTSGGSGFGVMAIVAGIRRNFISSDEGREQL